MGQLKPRFESTAAIVLCGGESRRMGLPKALLKFGETTFLESVIAAVSDACGTVIVVAAPDQTLQDLPGHVRVVHDPVPHRGPLTGITTGLAALPATAEYVYVTGTDTPLLRSAVVATMLDFALGHDLAIPFDGAHHQPLAAAYRVEFAMNRCRELIAQNRHRSMFLMENADFVEVGLESLRTIDPELVSYRNVNSPADYRALLEDYGLSVPIAFRAALVEVEFFGVPRLRAGTERVAVYASTVGELVTVLARDFPDSNGALIEAGRLHPAYMLIRGRSERLSSLDTPLFDADRLQLVKLDAGA